MKFFGEKSVSSVVHNLLRFWYGLMIIMCVIFIPISVIMYLKNPTSYGDISSITSGMFEFKLDEKVKSIGIVSVSYFGVLYLVELKISKDLFSNFRNNIVFDKRNVKYINYLAYLKLLLSLIFDIDEYLRYKIAVANINVEGLTIDYKFMGNTRESIFLVITYFMIAIALKEAIKYKEDSELTV